jgi:hypothetical protein
MPNRYIPDVCVEEDQSERFTEVRGLHESNRKRDLNLEFTGEGSGHRLNIITDNPDLIQHFGKDRSALIDINLDLLLRYIWEFRKDFEAQVISYCPHKARIFDDCWDLSASTHHLDKLLPRMATLGYKLFIQIFAASGPSENKTLAKKLQEAMRKRPLNVRITSDSFFAPWSLLYAGDDPDTAGPIQPEHFWGYHHWIEHTPPGQRVDHVCDLSPVRIGIQFDQKIDQEFKVACLAPVLGLLQKIPQGRLESIRRPLRTDFEKAVRSGPRDEHILYFCCHATHQGDLPQQRPYIVLSDLPRNAMPNWITPDDISIWLGLNEFTNRPLVFLNACGVTQISSSFYRNFARAFLNGSACSVIGPQVAVPAVFAGEFARAFFKEFLQGGPNNAVGEIIRRLRRHFLDNHGNPLGLIYELYRGSDVFLRNSTWVVP